MYEPDRACVIQVEKVVKMPTFYEEDTAASANEVWSRLHSDPLFAVRALGPSCLPIKLASQRTDAISVLLSSHCWSCLCQSLQQCSGARDI